MLLLDHGPRGARTPAAPDPQALIEEARRRARRRRARRGGVGLGVAVAIGVAFGVVSHDGSHAGVSGGAAKRAVAPEPARPASAGLGNIYVVHVASAAGVTVAGSGGVLATRDAGVHWRTITPRTLSPILVGHIVDIAAFGTARIWLEPVGDERMDFIPFTDNGGATWSVGVLAGGAALSGSPLSFWTRENGLALGDINGGGVRVYATDDGGASWKYVAGATPGPFGGPDTFTSARDGWTWNRAGSIYRTQDGGRIWQPVRLPPRRGYTLLTAAQPESFGSDVVIAASLRSPDGRVRTAFYASEGGAIWRAHVAPGTSKAASATFAASGTDWFTLSGSELLATTDAGRTWRQTRIHTATGDSIYAIDYLSSTIGWAEAYGPRIGDLYPRYLLRSSDGGRTWQQVNFRR